MRKRTAIIVISLILTVLALSGCGNFLKSDRPAASTWWLEPVAGSANPARDGPALHFTLRVVPGLDTDRILTLDGDARLNHYAGARWPDGLPEVLHSVLGRSLAAAGGFSAVTDRAGRPGDSCRLDVEVREFFARVDSGGATRSVRVALEGSLDCGAGARVIPVAEAGTVGAQDMRSIVAAFQAVLDRATGTLIGQLTDS